MALTKRSASSSVSSTQSMWWNVNSAECSQKEKKFLGSDFVEIKKSALLHYLTKNATKKRIINPYPLEDNRHNVTQYIAGYVRPSGMYFVLIRLKITIYKAFTNN